MYLAADKIGYGEKFKKLVLDWDRATLIERFFSNHSQKFILPYLGYSVDNNSCQINIFDEELFKLALDNFISWLDPKNAEKITTQMVTNSTMDKYFNENFIPDINDFAMKTDKPLKVFQTKTAHSTRGRDRILPEIHPFSPFVTNSLHYF